ncbi:hypothetical protein DV735_g3251, partial [Chaetothyriales sp. CBS 134920]
MSEPIQKDLRALKRSKMRESLDGAFGDPLITFTTPEAARKLSQAVDEECSRLEKRVREFSRSSNEPIGSDAEKVSAYVNEREQLADEVEAHLKEARKIVREAFAAEPSSLKRKELKKALQELDKTDNSLLKERTALAVNRARVKHTVSGQMNNIRFSEAYMTAVTQTLPDPGDSLYKKNERSTEQSSFRNRLIKAYNVESLEVFETLGASEDMFQSKGIWNNSPDSLWCIIDHKVYDLTDFVDAHPGGNVVLQQVAGQDATAAFYNLHRHEVLQKYDHLRIGTIEGEQPEVVERQPGGLSVVPYGEPLWLTPAFKSPYFNESHRALQRALREFVDRHVYPEAQEKEQDGTYISQNLVDKMAQNNLLAMRLGPGKHLHGRQLLGGIKGEEFDYFHDMLVLQELARANARGFEDGNMGGMMISLTAVQHWANDPELRDRVTEECLTGKKFMCLAITEAFAGSDVAGLRTTAEKTPDGKHYIINGTKKWITNGMFADYFVTGCRTKNGFSVILIPRDDNVETKRIKTSYSGAAGTAFVQFDNVKVPVNHLLGKEDQGFIVIMSNFNHERWSMVALICRWLRTICEECLKWSHQRIVFGKPLIAQPVIRQKLAKMISLTEASQSWLETIAFQLNNLDYAQQSKLLGGPIGLLKSYVTRCAHEIADDAVNIFGGRGITQTGMGRVVEEFHRTYKFDAILGGTEEILADLGVRQAMKFMPKAMFADSLMDNLNDLYGTARDEFEIAMEETESNTVYAADDREAAVEAFGALKDAYEQAIREADPETGAEIQRRVGQRIRELEAAIENMQKLAIEGD